MRKRYGLIACGVVIALLSTTLLIHLHRTEILHRNPLKRLELSRVEYISIYMAAGKKEVQLSEEDAADLVHQMSQVEVGEETQDCFSGEWQGVRFPCFHVKQKDNTEFDFSPSPPFYIISTEKFGFQLQKNSTSRGYWAEGDEQDAICYELAQTYVAFLKQYFPE